MENYLRQMSKTTCRKSLHLAGTPQLGKAAKRPEERRQWRNPPRRGRTQARSPTPSDDPQKRKENHDNKENRQRPQGTEGQPRATRRPPQAATRHATKTKANATDTRPGDIPPREDKESRTKKNASPTRARKGTTTQPPPRAIANAHVHIARKQHSGSRHNFGARDPFPD